MVWLVELSGTRGADGLAWFSFSTGAADVLDGPGGELVKDRCGVKWPVWVAEQLSGKEDEIGLASADDLVGLGRFGDHSDSGGGNFVLAANSVGVMHLVAGAYRDLLSRMVAAGGDVYEIDICLLEQFGEGDGLGEFPACAERLRSPVGGGYADEDGQVLGPRGADSFYYLEGKTGAIFEASAVLVGALIGERREELVQEIAVGGVYLDEVEACSDGAMGCCDEVGDDLVHAGAIESCGQGIGLIEANGRRCYGLPTAFSSGHSADGIPWEGHAGFAAGVG